MLNITIQLTSRLDPIGHLAGWASATYIKRDMQAGAWELELPVKPNNVGLLNDWLDADVPGIIWRDADSGWAEWGILSEYDISNFGDGSATRLHALGTDLAGLAAERIVTPATWPGFNDPINLTTGEADGVAWDWVNRLVASATVGINGDIGVVTFMEGARPTALPSTTVSAHGANLLEQVRSILAGSDTTMLASFPRAAGESRRLQFEVRPRPTSGIPLSTKAGNVQRVNVSRRKAKRTWLQGIGADVTAVTRETYNAQSTTGKWNTRQAMGMLNNPQLAAAELAAAVDQEIAASGPAVAVSAVDPDPSAWGLGVDVGHLVDVAVPLALTGGIEFLPLPVVSATLKGERGAWTRTVEFGEAELRDAARLVDEIVQLRSTTDRLNRSL